MIFQPAIIALLLASATGALLLAACAPNAVRVLQRWDLASGSEYQLRLERRTYLVSTIVAFVLAAQALALLLFVFNADRMAVMFVGAMCAVGSLNANGFGFPALLAQIAVFFLACTWLILNHLDTSAEDYPLVRVKYRFLLAIAPTPLFTGAEAVRLPRACLSSMRSDPPAAPRFFGLLTNRRSRRDTLTNVNMAP